MPYHIYHIFVFSASQCHSEFSITGNGKTWIKRNPKLWKTCVVCLFIFLSTWFVRFEKTLWCECSKSILFLWFIICIISYQLSNREFEIKVNSLNNKTHSHPQITSTIQDAMIGTTSHGVLRFDFISLWTVE